MTAFSASEASRVAPSSLGFLRCTVTGAVVLAIQFAICWAAAFVAPGFMHMYVSIFTAQPMDSLGALGEGLAWSALFGGLTGALVAIVYNLLAALDRR